MTGQRIELEIAGKTLSLESGRVAKQAGGSVWVRYGDTVILVAASAAKQAKPDIDFMPLTVDYQERFYAAGKIPGGFFKREGRPAEREILNSRLIDRPVRPLFPKQYHNETQIIAWVLSADHTNSTDFLGIIGASAALMISPVPFKGPVGAVRVGRVGGRLVINPDLAQMAESEINMVVACTRDAIMMVEGEAREVPESVMLDGILLAHEQIKPILDLQEKLIALNAKPKMEVAAAEKDGALETSVREVALGPLVEALQVADKAERNQRLAAIEEEVIGRLAPPETDDEGRVNSIKAILHDLERSEMRRIVLEKGVRADGRGEER